MRLLLITMLIGSFTAASLGGLPRSNPEAQGVSAAAILQFVDAAEKNVTSLHSFMLVRHGQVLTEGWWAPYAAPTPHALFSLTKSFTSTAVGLAIAEGKLRLDDEVLKFFPEEAPAQPGRNLKAMRVRDLLRMSTGQETESARLQNEPWTKSFLAHPVPFKPGTHFLYNTSGSCMLAAIVERSTGMPLADYLKPRLFAPLEIESPSWDKSPEGVNIGGYGLSVRTEDIARFGLLYLQKGKWQGRQLIPKAWVEEATALQTSNGSNPASDWDQGYGYQFWRCKHECYRGDGAFGQYCIVMPKQDAVVAITSGVADMQSVLNLVWERLLPSMKDSPLPGDEATDHKLQERLKALELPVEQGTATPADVFGKKYVFPSNSSKLEALTVLKDEGERTIIVAQFDGKEQRINCGVRRWTKSPGAWAVHGQPLAACGAWSAPDTFVAKICLYQTPFTYRISLRFAGEELRFNSEANVGFGSTREPELVGKLAARH